MLALIWGWLAGLGLLGMAAAVTTYRLDFPHKPTVRAQLLHAALTMWIVAGFALFVWWRVS